MAMQQTQNVYGDGVANYTHTKMNGYIIAL